MSIKPQDVLALVQVARLALETAELVQAGSMTPEELAARRQEIRERLDGANALWERAGQQG